MKKHPRVSKFGRKMTRLELALSLFLLVLKILLIVIKLAAVLRA